MAAVEIVWPEVQQLISDPTWKYVDIHGILRRCELRVTKALVAGRKPRNVLLNSKHGLGKTLMVATLAQRLRAKGVIEPDGAKVPMIVYDCSDDTKEYHLKGSFTIQPDGSTAFVPGPIPLVIEMANRTGFAVLCLEEMSALTPGAQKILNAITDWREGIFVPQIGQFLRLQKGASVLIMATMNPTVYGGVYTLNQDLRSRFVEERVPWPDMEQETKILQEICPYVSLDTIKSAVQLAKDTRTDATEYNLSTRDLVILLDELHDLPDMRDQVLLCVANRFEGNEQATVADRIDGIFKTKIKKLLAA